MPSRKKNDLGDEWDAFGHLCSTYHVSNLPLIVAIIKPCGLWNNKSITGSRANESEGRDGMTNKERRMGRKLTDSLPPFSPRLCWLSVEQMEDDSGCLMRFQAHGRAELRRQKKRFTWVTIPQRLESLSYGDRHICHEASSSSTRPLFSQLSKSFFCFKPVNQELKTNISRSIAYCVVWTISLDVSVIFILLVYNFTLNVREMFLKMYLEVINNGIVFDVNLHYDEFNQKRHILYYVSFVG